MEERIFEKYVRAGETATQGARAGLGLGLYLARHIAERHGGTIAVAAASPASRGACFEMVVPVVRPAQAA